MSAFAFCRNCFAWGLPTPDACPHCREPLDLSTPDPSHAELAADVGPLIGCLGEVRTPRRTLSGRGLLYATAGGLFFLPHDESHGGGDVEPTEANPLGWTIVSLMIPFACLIPLVVNRHARVVPRPRLVGSGEALATWLMADPGAFFIPRRNVRLIRRRWRGWTVDCANRPPVRFRPTDRAGFAAHFIETVDRAEWRGTLVD